MDFRIVAVVAVGIVAAFWLVPHQIMLATSNRLGDKRFHDFEADVGFPFYSRRRMLIAGGGFAVIIGLYSWLGPHGIIAILFGVLVFALYLADFLYIEAAAKRVTEAADDSSSTR